MAEKRKSTPKAKLLTVVLLVLFLGSCAVLVFAICTNILGVNSNSDNTTQPQGTTVAAIEVITTSNSDETVSSSVTESTPATENQENELYFGSEYEIVSVCDEQGSEMDLRVAFGNDFRDGNVEFAEGRFFINLTVQGPPSNYGGTYTFVSDSEVELRYDNSNIKSAFVKNVDDQGMVTEVDLTMSSDFVITCVLS